MQRARPVLAGEPLFEALADELDRLRAGDRLAPATVVCSGSLEAVQLRRALGRRRGVAGVEFVTAEAVAQRLARPALAGMGHWVASATEVRLALRAELSRATGLLARVAEHEATVDQLYHLHRELAGVSPLGLNRIIRVGGLGGEAVGVIVGAPARLGPARVEADVAALAELALEREPDMLGPVVVVGYEPSSAFQSRVVKALTAHGATTLRPVTGHRALDGALDDRVRGWSLPSAPMLDLEGSATVRRLDVADPDDEVAAAVRLVGNWAARDTSPHRIAVLVPPGSDLGPVVTERLTAGGIAAGGPGARPLARGVAGRTVLRLLELARTDVDRAGLFLLLSGAPVVVDGQRPPVARWDRWSREAGVIDAGDWRPRLEALASSTRERDPAQADAILGMVGAVEAFREQLRGPVLDDLQDRHPWSTWIEWLRGLLERHLPLDPTWPKPERAGHEMILERIELMARLERLVDRPTLADVASVVIGFCDRGVLPGAATSSGVLVAPVDQVAGLDAERVVVLGLADGILPRRTAAGGLLTAQHRADATELPLPNTRTARDHLAIGLAATAAKHEAVLLSSRGDLRGGRTRVWPDSLDGLLTEPEPERVVSHRAALAEHSRPSSLAEVGLRSLIRHVDRQEPVGSHPLTYANPALAAGFAWTEARRSGTFDGATGSIGAGRVRLDRRVSSPTALEEYATCPRRFLFGRLFRLGDVDRPERITDISARERGTLSHAVLERFLDGRISAGTVPEPGEPWGEDAVAEIAAIVLDEVDQRAALGLTGGRVRTELLRRRQLAEALHFLVTDDVHRQRSEATPVAVELDFGVEQPVARIDLGDGRILSFRGFIDRVDRLADGGVMVIDYKTGNPNNLRLPADDPLVGGRRLQLPLYASAAAAHLGAEGTPVGRYWFLSRSEPYGVDLDDELTEALLEVLRTIADGVAGGVFPAQPGAATAWPKASFEHCRYCDFDPICPADRHAEAERLEPVLVELRPGGRREGGDDA